MQWDLAAGDKSISLPTPLHPSPPPQQPTDSFSSNSFFVAKLMTAFDIQQTITMIFVRNQQHRVAPHTSVTSDCAVCRQSWGADLCSFSPVKPRPHYLISRVFDDTTRPHSNRGESLLCFRVKWTSRVQDMLRMKLAMFVSRRHAG